MPRSELIGTMCLMFTFLLMTSSVHARDKTWSTKYDSHFKKYAKRYFGPNVDWRWFKAQGIAESALNNEAVSAVGAQGIMQIMPATYKEIRKRNPHFKSVSDPRWNIAAGIYYDRYLYKYMTDINSFQHRLYLTFAGYNAGYGGVLKAVKRSKVPREDLNWRSVKRYLPRETQGYVSRIEDLKKNDLARN